MRTVKDIVLGLVNDHALKDGQEQHPFFDIDEDMQRARDSHEAPRPTPSEHAPEHASEEPQADSPPGPSSTEALRAERIAFEHCRRTVTRWWPTYWPYVEGVLSAAATLRLKDVPASIALFAMAPSGIGKNTIFKMFDWELQRLVLWRDKFTLASLQSHYQGESARKLTERALFRQAKHKLFITAELALLFRGNTSELESRFSELAQLLDGEGRLTDSGTHGALGEKGDFTGIWVGGTTPFYLVTWNTMAALGTRLLFFRIPKGKYLDDEFYATALKECKAAVSTFLEVLLPEGSIRSIPSSEWPSVDSHLKQKLQQYAALMALGHGRRQNIQGQPEAEFPSPNHFRSRLGYMVRGRALVYGRQNVDAGDLDMARWIAMSSMPQQRGPVLVELLEGQKEIGDIV